MVLIGRKRVRARAQAILPVFVVLALAIWALALAPRAANAESALSTRAQANQEAAGRALAWIKTQQQADGSFAGLGAGSTVDAVLAIESVGNDPTLTYRSGGANPIAFLDSKAAELAKMPGSAGKALLALTARDKSGNPLLGKQPAGTKTLLDSLSTLPPTAHYGQDTIGHAFAMLGLASATGSVPPKAAQYLESVQASNGGWSFAGDMKPEATDTNTTAVAIQALLAAGVTTGDPVLQRALAYLATQVNEDGGYPYQKGGEYGSDSDVNSTAYVAQALIAMNDGASGRAVAYLLSMQKPSGAFQWQKSDPTDNAGATYQAVPAIVGVTLVPNRAAPGQQASAPTQAGQGATPGMPATGQGNAADSLAAAIAGLGAVLITCGSVARRGRARRTG